MFTRILILLLLFLSPVTLVSAQLKPVLAVAPATTVLHDRHTMIHTWTVEGNPDGIEILQDGTVIYRNSVKPGNTMRLTGTAPLMVCYLWYVGIDYHKPIPRHCYPLWRYTVYVPTVGE